MRLASSLLASSLLLLATTSAYAEKTYAYNESLGTPPGWHVEERPRTALAITGGAIAATGAIFFAYGLSEQAAARRRAEELPRDPGFTDTPGSGGEILMWTGGIMAAVGLPLLIVGLTTKRSVLVRDTFAVAPIVSPSFGGLSLAATF